jgi:hypothetical protein
MVKIVLLFGLTIVLLTSCKGQSYNRKNQMQKTCYLAFNYIQKNELDSLKLLFTNEFKTQITAHQFDSALGKKIKLANPYLIKYGVPSTNNFKLDSINFNGVENYKIGFALPDTANYSNAEVFIIFSFSDKDDPNKLTGIDVFPNLSKKFKENSDSITVNNFKSLFKNRKLNSIIEFGFFGSKALINNKWEGNQFGIGNNLSGNISEDIKNMKLADFFNNLFLYFSNSNISYSRPAMDITNKGQAATLKVEIQINTKDTHLRADSIMTISIKDVIKEQTGITESNYNFIVISINDEQMYFLSKKDNSGLNNLLEQFYSTHHK